MTLISLPILLYVIPAVMLIAACVPPRRKPAVLGLGGLAYVYFTGGAACISLTVLSVCGAWLTLRLMQPDLTQAQTKRHAALGLLWQTALPIAAKFLIPPTAPLPFFGMLPVICCTMLGAESILSRANRQMYVPPLLAYISGACAMPHLWAGPVMRFPDLREMSERCSVSAERVGKGASRCIAGLFRMVLLAVPLNTLLTEVESYAPQHTLFDAYLILTLRYAMLFHWMRGAKRLGDGLALMLGFAHPKSMQHTAGADSLSEFWHRFSGSAAAWAERVVLGGETDMQPLPYLLRMLPLFAVLGWLFGRSICGVIFGVLQAFLLTLGRHPAIRARMKSVPLFLRQCGTVALVLLSFAMPFCRSLTELFSLWQALLGINGTAISSTARYLCGTHLLPLMLSVLLLFPLPAAFRRAAAEKPSLKRALAFCTPPVALGILLCCMAELLSQYLRG